MKLTTVAAVALAAALTAHAAPKATAAPVPTSTAAVDTARVNLNTATEADLQTLPGVGKATAAAVVAGRPWASLDDLTARCRGIGAKKAARLADFVTF